MNYDWTIVDHAILFQGYFRIEKYTFSHELFGGGVTGEFTRELFERGHAVAVLPYDPQRDTVVLIEQFRAGVIGKQDPPWLKEVIAGIIETGENEQQVALRECREEAGCEIQQLEPITRYFVSPGGTTEQCALFCGRVDSRGIGGIHGLADEFEDIRVEVVSVQQAAQWLEQGIINSAAAIISLQWLLLNRDRLRRIWA